MIPSPILQAIKSTTSALFGKAATPSQLATAVPTPVPTPKVPKTPTSQQPKTTKKPKAPKQPLPPARIPDRLLVLSIGNPSEYDGTRHSVGHYVLNRLTSRLRAQSTRAGRFDTWMVKGDPIVDKEGVTTHPGVDIWLYRVPGYMNVSGKSVAPFYKAFTQNVGDAEVVVLFDELDLDFGKVKIRKQGSSHRGHNGLRDIQKYEIGKDYTGVQIGIGRNYVGDKNQAGVVANYVLSKFKPEEREVIDDVVVDRVISLLEEMKKGKHVFERVKN